MEKYLRSRGAVNKRMPLVIFIFTLVLAFSLGVLGVAAEDQVILDWEKDGAGNPLVSGQVIDDEFHATEGVSITISGVSNRQNGPNLRAIFPSSVLPIDGNGNPIDEDLGSPNDTCVGGGPGKGLGGVLNSPGENCVSLGNVLILPTIGDGNNDGFIDGLPNDDLLGGLGIFKFSEPVTVDYLELLDMESPESVAIRAYITGAEAPSETFVEFDPAPLGDNSFQRVEMNVAGVTRLEVEYIASGALATLAFTPNGPTATTMVGMGVSSQSSVVWILPLLVLLVAAASAGLLRRQQIT